MQELELYKLIATDDNSHGINLVDEFGWITEDEFGVWVSYLWLNEFMEELRDIFGDSMFDEGGFDGNFQYSGVYLNLSDIVDWYGVNLKEMFPYEKYQH